MLLCNISIPLMGLADSVMLAHSNSPIHLGAVAVGSNLLALMLWTFSFLRMGTTVYTGQAMGAKDDIAMLAALYHHLLLAIGISLLLVLAQWWIVPSAIALLSAEPALEPFARDYTHLRLMAAPATLCSYVVIGWFIGLQKTRAPLIIVVSANLANIGLDYVFIVVLEKGSFGAGIASMMAEYIGVVIGLCLLYKESRGYKTPGSLKKRPALASNLRKTISRLGPYLKTNGDLFIRTASLLGVFNFFTAQSTHFGVDILAANALLLQLMLFIAYALDSYAHAAESLVAESWGARNIPKFSAAAKTCFLYSILIALGLTLFLAFAEPLLIQILTDKVGVRQALSSYFFWVLLLPLCSVWAYVLDGIFIGMGSTRLMRNTMLVATVCIFFPAWYLCSRLLAYENHGLWLAFIVFNAARGILLGLVFPYALNADKAQS